MLKSLFSRFRRNRHPDVVPRRRLDADYSSSPRNDDKLTIERVYSSRRYQQYRRNQTITGSTSANIASAGEIGGQMQSPRAASHHLRRKQRSLLGRLVLTLGTAGVLFFVLYNLVARVEVSIYGQVNDSQSSPEVTEIYEQTIQNYFSTRPLERLRPLLDEDNLARYLQAGDASEVREITSITPTEIGSARFELKMREPIAIWTINGRTQYVDGDGSIFARNFYLEPRVEVVDESGIRFEDVTAVTSSRFLRFIGVGIGYGAERELPIDRAIVPAETTRQVQFALNNNEKTRLKLTVDRPVGEQVEDALVAYTELKRKGQKPTLIDVRVSGKAFYR
jgi:hypothetical protein